MAVSNSLPFALKLLEEVNSGEAGSSKAALEARAAELIDALDLVPCADPVEGMSPFEMGSCVANTPRLPEVAVRLSSLHPEYPLWTSNSVKLSEQVMAGIADAVSINSDGRLRAVIDWKSDVAPSPSLPAQYRAQVAAYVKMAGADRGLNVIVSTGQVL
ncbi:hypothetical protein [Pseudoduganella danionis]|uniref:hypothetical protein n=1 Tax=Pseudoduganella danionis TaxID=1890295 RepID=UPI0035B1100F